MKIAQRLSAGSGVNLLNRAREAGDRSFIGENISKAPSSVSRTRNLCTICSQRLGAFQTVRYRGRRAISFQAKTIFLATKFTTLVFYSLERQKELFTKG